MGTARRLSSVVCLTYHASRAKQGGILSPKPDSIFTHMNRIDQTRTGATCATGQSALVTAGCADRIVDIYRQLFGP